jgi:hypothetical protein
MGLSKKLIFHGEVRWQSTSKFLMTVLQLKKKSGFSFLPETQGHY